MTVTPATHSADILIVDDMPDNIRFLSSLLIEQGYRVRKAINGKMALTAIQTIQPDLILLDINLPDMNGYEVCESLKQDEQTQSIPIIFLSALNEALDKVKAFQVGGVDYITKPFQLEEILVRVKHHLMLKTLQNQLQHQNQELQTTLGELRKTQAQLLQKQKMLSLGQLASGMAHEINNSVGFISSNLKPAKQYIQDLLELIELYQQEYPYPSDTIQAFMEEINLDFLEEDVNQLIGSMQTGTERIQAVILALRIFSRLNESEIKSVDIHEGIKSVLVLLQSRLYPENKPPIRVVETYNKLPLVTCYASQINQVIFNLLNNAIDAIEAARDRLQAASEAPTIWITTTWENPDLVTIKIQDNGIGIPETMQSRLFDPFFTTKAVGKGTGLSLLTSYQIIVEKHQGQLICVSAPHQGAEFKIELPLKLTTT
ncbi:response regulator [Desertifilum sp. FACHB-1129]|nr:response regulator [Desertifilum sp. FACHB-1129]MBD2322608.1 response regulator [Desertifilum sp. FACHB-866]MBD2333486.1 response regulator [Desertifilum sp. FACHB-868]OEJ76205.1 hybrid sensor histidine kinase/response regulator [Desertifilum tharense IPPAS B-1220]